ncbi:MAG: hypothetical protein EOP60_07965 [Sphingomonadales bacterium]|nr:MAG: hypothetical protein EOP60_07965 [Sphingomonadales bacterium]
MLRLTVSGFWAPADVPAFARAVGAETQRVRAIRDDFDVIVDSLEFPVQSNDVADLLTNVMTGGAPSTSGRFAVVVGSQLNRLQAERTLVHPRLRVFLSLAEAQDWLAG